MIPDIFNYLDYRHFLKDYYAEQKKTKGALFSFRSFARLSGFKSPNFLKLVMDGQRNLSTDSIQKFSKALKLNKEETLYFTHLVNFNQSNTDEERNLWYQKLSSSKKYREIREIENNYFVYFSRWYYVAIRELVLLPHFQEKPAWIAKQLSPKISTQEAQRAIELLLTLGFLKRNAAGKLVQADRNITTAKEVSSLAIANFHRLMITKALDSIEKTPSSKRDISGITVALSQQQFLEVKRRIQEFRRELNVLLSEENKPDSVYQINFQVFNLTELK